MAIATTGSCHSTEMRMRYKYWRSALKSGYEPFRTARVGCGCARQLGHRHRARMLSPPLKGQHRLSYLQRAPVGRRNFTRDYRRNDIRSAASPNATSTRVWQIQCSGHRARRAVAKKLCRANIRPNRNDAFHLYARGCRQHFNEPRRAESVPTTARLDSYSKDVPLATAGAMASARRSPNERVAGPHLARMSKRFGDAATRRNWTTVPSMVQILKDRERRNG